MRVKILLLFLSFSLPAHAETQSYGERTQETVPVGDNKFLIFVGAPDASQSGYTADMIQIEEGIPFYVPLFMEEYDPESNTTQLGYGVAFQAISYDYNKMSKTLDIRTMDDERKKRYNLRYSLDTDILHLKKVTSEESSCTRNCKQITLFSAAEKK
ncbi:MAG: hypothetical protein K2Q01_11735 [Rickettsiales bacterium]|nr:hypothetical protein [Rickettsiales bacterium]